VVPRSAALLVLLLCGCAKSPGVAAPALNGSFVELAGVQPLTWPPRDPEGVMDPPSSGGLFADLDGDGRPEVLITQYDSSGGVTVVYQYDGAQLQPAPQLPLPTTDPLVAAMDLDGDGLLDLVYSGSIYWGQGGGQYSPGQLPSMAYAIQAIWDIDGNGLVDLVLTPWCSAPQVLLQTAPRQFVAAPSLVMPGQNVSPNAGFVGMVDDQLLLGMIGFACPSPNVDVPIFYSRQGSDTFQAVALVPGLSFSIGSAMGATTGADLDGDGHLDLFVALNPQHVLISNGHESRQSFYEVTAPSGKPMIPWSALFFDLDEDGRMDVLFTHGADSLYSDIVMGIGKERVSAHWNSGHGFARWGSLGDLDRLGDWRVLGVGDLDGDGDADLIVGGFGEDPHVYRNDIQGNGVALRLLDKHGMPAYGAKLTLTAATTQQLQVAGIATQHEINEPLVFAGLGAATSGQLDITWTDGSAQSETVTAGRLTEIKER
jgi:hypothetical protein